MQTDLIKASLDPFIDGKHIPGYVCLISRNGREIGYLEDGYMDVAANKRIARDNIFRIYSMTKPLTSVAMMQLYEQGKFSLQDPVHRYIPEWRDLRVFADGDADNYSVVEPDRSMTVLDLFTHTSGLTYDFMDSHPVDELYRRSGITGESLGVSLEKKAAIMARLPLQFSPGSLWNYSVSTDVLGYLVQLLSDQPLDEYLAQHVTAPIGMTDTGFFVKQPDIERFAACYQANPENGQYQLQDDPATSRFRTLPAFISGGGGMVSTVDDYQRFCQTLLNGGALDGTRILKPETVRLMTQNHLPDNRDLAAMGQSVFTETPYDHIGFGLGFSVVLDGKKTAIKSMTGEYAWGGLASTCFWIDPNNQLSVVFMTQLIPSDAFPIRQGLREAVYASLEADPASA